MKTRITELLDAVTPATNEHKDVLKCFLAFPVLLFAIIGMLGLILNYMR